MTHSSYRKLNKKVQSKLTEIEHGMVSKEYDVSALDNIADNWTQGIPKVYEEKIKNLVNSHFGEDKSGSQRSKLFRYKKAEFGTSLTI